MPKLIPMTQPEFDAFLERTIPDYASQNVKAGYWHEDEALERSRTEHERLLPQGLHSENHYFYTLYDEDQPVGMVWMRAAPDHPLREGFIFLIWMDEKFRGKGYGRQAMLLLEEKARELGLKSLALRVFASNGVARGLYESLEYEVTSLNMKKSLG
jgi:ribosomal protein S18 acetylase RimI-like enzyme